MGGGVRGTGRVTVRVTVGVRDRAGVQGKKRRASGVMSPLTRLFCLSAVTCAVLARLATLGSNQG